MNSKPLFLLISMVILVLASIFSLSGCSGSITETVTPTTSGGSGGGAVINSDSIVTAQIKAIRQPTGGYPWELDVLIQSSTDVGSLPNPTKDSIGKVITVKTDQDLTSFKVNDTVSARVKYVGDVPKPGITLYIYDIVKS